MLGIDLLFARGPVDVDPLDCVCVAQAEVQAQHLHPKPKHLTWEQSAAIPLGGLTTYRALLTKGKAKKGDKVLVTGVGGGTGTFALQFALAAGCQVFVTSGSGDKIDKARRLGASAGVNYKAQDWAEQLQQLTGGFDVVIDSVLGESFGKIPDLCNPGARIVTFGATMGDTPPLNGRKIFWKQLQIIGTTMGTSEDFKAMIDFVAEHEIVPVIDEAFALADAKKAFDKMGRSSQFGKLVLRT